MKKLIPLLVLGAFLTSTMAEARYGRAISVRSGSSYSGSYKSSSSYSSSSSRYKNKNDDASERSETSRRAFDSVGSGYSGAQIMMAGAAGYIAGRHLNNNAHTTTTTQPVNETVVCNKDLNRLEYYNFEGTKIIVTDEYGVPIRCNKNKD